MEGYTDLWRLWQSGIKDVLSIYGTRGLETFLNPRKGYAYHEFSSLIANKDIWVFMDSDVPGRQSAVYQTLMLQKAIHNGIINSEKVYVVVGPSEEDKMDPADLSQEEVQSLLSSQPMDGEDYIRWWLEMGVDTNDEMQIKLVRRKVSKLLQEVRS